MIRIVIFLLGGIPHDLFGMTTRSIHTYVTGIYSKTDLLETDCKKIQTGGPDGDLGSNEIKISKDKTIAVIDGSGVLYDFEGINRTELLRLANKRQMICNFDVSLLNPGKGFRVLVDERNVTLPNGFHVEDGLSFRNEFHLLPFVKADLFVPCGGRPESVDINNVKLLLDDSGIPRYRYIVEGANLFFTQDARIRLESNGVIIFKDASANKGGVTSSSLEVLAALAMTDEEYDALMRIKEGQSVSAFYSSYVAEVHEIIEKNASLEFECLWKEHLDNPNSKLSVLSDQLSIAIEQLDAELQQENNILWNNLELRKLVIEEALPKLLVKHLGMETILSRIPESYLKAIFASYLSSRFVYNYGIQPNQFSFFQFMSEYMDKMASLQCARRIADLNFGEK